MYRRPLESVFDFNENSFKPDKKWSGEPIPGCWYTEKEFNAVMQATKHQFSNWNVGYEDHLKNFEQLFSEYVGAKYALAINGAGTGFDMILKSLDLNEDDEIISCAINFHGTHLAIINSGAKLTLCECEENGINIDPEDMGRKITPRTRAVIVTHMNGIACDLDRIKEIISTNQKNKDIEIIEDAARSCGSEYKGNKIGKDSFAAVFSFQSKKQMSTLGEGGMIVTNNKSLHEKIFKYRSFGCGDGWGTNFKMTRIQAAVGIQQLKRLEEMNNQRIRHAKRRNSFVQQYLPNFVAVGDIKESLNTYYLYTLLVPESWIVEKRNMLIKSMEEKYLIGCVIANLPTYKTNQFIEKYVEKKFLRSERISCRIICPVLHPLMSEIENDYILYALYNSVKEIESRQV